MRHRHAALQADRRPIEVAAADPARRRFLVAAAGASALLALPAWARSWSASVASPAEFLGWTEVRPGVFATTNLSTGGNSLVVGGEAGSLLVDTKYPVFAKQLARDAEALTGHPVARVVNTHHHGDHVAGNLAFGGVPIAAHRNAVPRVEQSSDRLLEGLAGGQRMAQQIPEAERGPIEADLESMLKDADDLGPDAWTPDTPISDGTTGFDLGGTWVELHAMGHKAHTDNDILVVLPDRNVIHTGDLVFNGLFPFMDPNGGGTARGWMDALRGIIGRCDAETAVVPGHGEITDVDGVRAQLAHFEHLFEAIGAEVDKGTPLEEVKAMTWPFMEGLGFERIRERGNEFVYNEITAGRE